MPRHPRIAGSKAEVRQHQGLQPQAQGKVREHLVRKMESWRSLARRRSTNWEPQFSPRRERRSKTRSSKRERARTSRVESVAIGSSDFNVFRFEMVGEGLEFNAEQCVGHRVSQ